MEDIRIICVLVTLLPLICGYSEPNAFDPVIKSSEVNARGFALFRGQIREDETTVDLRPGLSAYDEDSIGLARLICKYKILKSKKRGKIPFVIELKNKTTGQAEIRVREKERLDFEKRSHYKFEIIAKDCGDPPRLSDVAVVQIKVKDVDEFAPTFENSSYFATVQEGKMYTSIVSLRASDGDRSADYQGICDYEILTPEVPFEIDHQGNLKNTEPLDFNIHRNYILKVVASDCGKKRSKPVFVNIVVEELCRSGWQDVRDHIPYVAGSGRQKIAERARLQLCEEGCTPEKIAVRMTLATKHIGKGCDRDTYSITSQRKLCGASGESVDLLPSPSLAAWTRNLPTDDGHESDQLFSFDGHSNAVEVPDVHFNHTIHEHFTISTWMKHEALESYSSQHRAPKEHVLCMSDGEHMSRHHYSLFVHGEKFVFLMRREATSPEEMEIFKPAEWRWHIPQINDGEWHHYAISVDFPEVRLYIDGKLLIPDKTSLEIVDDWPLHSSHKVHFTKLTIGACWQGGENRYEHHFRGYLAGLSFLKDKTESDRVIKCLNNCKENLDFHALNDMQSGTSVSFNSEMTEFSISGRDVTEVEKLMREVTYVNARTYPTPGRRNLQVETTIVCDGAPRQLPTIESYVMVQEPPKPIITIGGDTNLTRLIYQFERGLRIFQDVHIYATQQEEDIDVSPLEDDEDKASKLAYKLSKSMVHQSTEAKTNLKDGILIDSCTIHADPPLNLFFEHLSLPTHMMENLGLEWSETNDGVTVTNADKMERYIGVIRNIHYYHNQPDILNSRTLTLSCSSQNQRFVSNKFTVKLVAVHEVPQVKAHANAQQAAASAPVRNALENVKSASAQQFVATSSNFGMAAIIVVCVGFLLFMIILGVIRIRAAHRRTQVVQVDEKCEMEWDNSALNITVNPMEQEVFDYEDNGMQSLRDESDSDDDGSSFHDDGESSDEEPPKVPTNGQDLEWDHSNLGF
ncbi:calsyntenin-1-like [Haliotis asinina]|uniref:calsyntenin-1-like n=1 Tax=Haliotis asinina TaxID=109174 RepID=UPI003532088C